MPCRVHVADLEKRGAKFGRDDQGKLVVTGPKSLQEDLAEGVRERMGLIADFLAGHRPQGTRRHGQCDACLGKLPAYRGGWCAFCARAAQKQPPREDFAAAPRTPDNAAVAPQKDDTDAEPVSEAGLHRRAPWEGG